MRFRRLNLSPVNQSLRIKVTLGVILPLVLILGVVAAVEYSRHKREEFTDLSFLATQVGQVIENGLRHEMLSENPQGLQHMLDAIGQDQTIRSVYLLNTSGQVVFAPEEKGVGEQLDNQDPTCQPCHRLPVADRPGSVVVTLPGGQRVFRSMNPIENQPACYACHDPDQRLNGLLLTDISMTALDRSVTAHLRENLLWWAATIILTAIVVNVAMSQLVVKRLEKVAQALGSFGKGERDLRLPVNSEDEIGQLVAAYNLMGQRIQTKEAENLTLSESLRHHVSQQRRLLKRLITAQEDERKRVARELHDSFGQALAGLALQVNVLEQSIKPEPRSVKERLNLIRGLISDTSDCMYDLIIALRPAVLDDLGLVAAIRSHADRVLKDGGVDFQLDARGMGERLPPDLETALYRMIQEALNNIVRHSKAKKVVIQISRSDHSCEVEIVDDGLGFVPELVHTDGQTSSGLGLMGMRERITQCDGELEIRSTPGSGTRVRIRIPLKEDCIDG